MFGMGFFEILMIAVVAIIFLGPEKLPKALVDVAKFFRAVKKTMDDAKDALDKEVNISKIKEEALAYKESFTQGAQNLTKELNLKSLELDENILDGIQEKPQDSKDSKDSKSTQIDLNKPQLSQAKQLNFKENSQNTQELTKGDKNA
ncbi:MAG: Sec-independent protein translocase protein TatB [Helicobacter sp.]|nr:Sec-independent protein translocase protein TatB [Helicobacter sp.]